MDYDRTRQLEDRFDTLHDEGATVPELARGWSALTLAPRHDRSEVCGRCLWWIKGQCEQWGQEQPSRGWCEWWSRRELKR